MAFTINGTSGINLATQPLTGSLPDANAPSGGVVQVVSTTSAVNVSSTSSTYATTGLSVSITPSNTTSKILIRVSGGNIDHINQYAVSNFTLYKNGATFTGATNLMATYNSYSNRIAMPVCLEFLDSPATTSSTTYTLYFSSVNGGQQVTFGGFNSSCTITAMEIAG